MNNYVEFNHEIIKNSLGREMNNAVPVFLSGYEFCAAVSSLRNSAFYGKWLFTKKPTQVDVEGSDANLYPFLVFALLGRTVAVINLADPADYTNPVFDVLFDEVYLASENVDAVSDSIAPGALSYTRDVYPLTFVNDIPPHARFWKDVEGGWVDIGTIDDFHPWPTSWDMIDIFGGVPTSNELFTIDGGRFTFLADTTTSMQLEIGFQLMNLYPMGGFYDDWFSITAWRYSPGTGNVAIGMFYFAGNLLHNHGTLEIPVTEFLAGDQITFSVSMGERYGIRFHATETIFQVPSPLDVSSSSSKLSLGSQFGVNYFLDYGEPLTRDMIFPYMLELMYLDEHSEPFFRLELWTPSGLYGHATVESFEHLNLTDSLIVAHGITEIHISEVLAVPGGETHGVFTDTFNQVFS